MIDGARPAGRQRAGLDSWRDDAARQEVGADSSQGRHATSGNGPLDGMRIVSFDHVLAGPYGTTILAELGADVVKVESSKGGMDPFRFFGTGEDPNLSPRFLEFNRNKRSFTVNLKHPKGQGVLHDLVAKADAVLDNYSVDVVERIGLAYDQLCKVKPDIVNLRMPGLGTTGPKRHFSTVGVNITAFTGLTYMWNHPGTPTRPSARRRFIRIMFPGCCARSLLFPACSTVIARRRARSSILAQSEATAFMIGANLMEAAASGKDPEPIGNASFSVAPHDCYPCKGEDRWCVIAAESEAQWTALARHSAADIDQDAVSTPTRPAQTSRGAQCRDRAVDAKQDAFEVRDRLQSAGVPCGVVQTGEDLCNDPQLKERGFIVAVENPPPGPRCAAQFPAAV